MTQILTKSISFNGKNILFTRKNGQYWIAVKSVCETLNVNYNRQFQQIKQDAILGAVFANQQMQIPGDQSRSMACLPENYIYGWIFSIDSRSEILIQYKKECYDILFKHFHGVITRRAEIHSEIAKEKRHIKALTDVLNDVPEYAELTNAKMREARLWKNLKDTSDIIDMFESDDLFEGQV